MRNPAAIRARGLGKSYQIYPRPQDRLKQSLFLGRRQFYREFWALRDVSFSVGRGETLGIIGRNGSGKSTLLQIIAGTLRPTEGHVDTQGRITALLELGSGFNPDFTGRENVFLNGSILGLPAKTVEERFDEIAAFADIGEFIDQPVQTYSSGMRLRLAFAVQVLLDPDILVVDEALAVGDAAFSVKCITRMKKMTEQGLSVVLVTHDVQLIRTFCHRALWLDHGHVRAVGDPREVTSRYLEFLFAGAARPAAADLPGANPAGAASADRSPDRWITPEPCPGASRWGSGDIRITGFALTAASRESPDVFTYGAAVRLKIRFSAVRDAPSECIGVGFALRNPKGLDVMGYTSYEAGVRFPPLRAGDHVEVALDFDNLLAPGQYLLVLSVEDAVSTAKRQYYDFIEHAALFRTFAEIPVYSLVLPPVHAEILECPPRVAGARSAPDA